MRRYLVDLYPDEHGDHVVHREGCARRPTFPLNLGHHTTCHEALVKARKYFARSNGCLQCTRDCRKHR
jgi:hypothetical protein